LLPVGRNLSPDEATVVIPSSAPEARLLALAPRGVVMLLGAGDTGKTTLTLAVANAAVAAGIPTAVVDADVGQSEVGPPGTIALARLSAPVSSWEELKPSAMAFVGGTSPAGHLLPVVVGTKRMVEEARRGGAELVLVDTSGLVAGELGRTLKLHKIDLVAPDLVVALHRGDELDPIVRLAEASGVRVERLPVAAAARPKPPGLRRARRAAHFHRYFEGARLHEIDARAVATAGSWLFTGEALAPRFLRFAERVLGVPVPYGELMPDSLRLVARARSGGPERGRASALADLQEQFHRPRVLLTPPHAFQGLLVGLLEPGRLLVALGILEAVDFDAGRLNVRTPLFSIAAVRQLRFGRLRLRPDGSEIGLVRPGEL
jgi:polynucleotide 5'-hydroxyl-kinase GRC3/NOL9